MKKILCIYILVILYGCGKDYTTPKEGRWRAVLELDDSKEIPFLFDYTSDNAITILNGEEAIKVKDIQLEGDSITINMPVFESVFKGVYTGDSINGIIYRRTSCMV